MKIAICTRPFPPLIGGLENVAEMTADALGRTGADVTVVTAQAGPPMPDRAYCLIRQPRFWTAWRAYRQAEVVLMLNVSLRMILPILLSFRPTVVWHHGIFQRQPAGIPARLKNVLTRHFFGINFACSDFVANTLPSLPPKITVANPYDDQLFYQEPGIERSRDLLFVGRLVSDKGGDILLRAIAKGGGPLATARLTIAGTGPEESVFRNMINQLGLTKRVELVGSVYGSALRRLFNQHRILVVPSTWDEPFGIVALEGIACGCLVAASTAGGLPQAVGQCGLLFKKGDAESCANLMKEALENYEYYRKRFMSVASSHLQAHRPTVTARQLLKEIESLCYQR